ncbi:carboxylesterase/lipase family protein [Nocardia sp. NPDC059180]|uniref:carboxylesterase/lipase family protein n=1 Tax=Nocardia sp. NPDC059180 TaxID=3346761 RepID=UPI003675EF2B
MIVDTHSGKVRGTEVGAVTAFRGIPYARAARFEDPEAVIPWVGVLDAECNGPAAPQTRSRLSAVMGEFDISQSEDCLSVNVWAPSGSGLPVLVFLHGGGFISGAGDLPWYDGAELAARGNIVVVTANYRLGALGFLRLDGVSPGNLGLLDQLAALRWVRDNIAGFGGDPSGVTVAGQSAGALSILAALSSHRADGLFRRAILQSAPAGMDPQTPAAAERVGAALLDELGIEPGAASSLIDVPVSDLLAAQTAVMRRTTGPMNPVPPFHLVADGDLVPSDPVGVVGMTCREVDLTVGTTRDEAAAFAPGEPDVIRAVTERMFAAPARRLALLLGTGERAPWLYRFDWSPTDSPFGACHCIELPFVFGNPAAWRDAPMLGGQYPDRLAARVMRAWIGFIRGGAPGWARGTTHLFDES